ncbi:DUF975 family protein [Streptococcus orisratti]|uniref:DUF975 family protein n=1 Tax=Streptococcus orisratti TaxID=114652 RepID=UPI00036792E0|nr:DUF975 family protein [Streptococcus orisratti]
MKTRKELKQEAKDALRGNWGWAIALFVLPYTIISAVLYALIFVIALIASVTSDPYSGEISPVIILIFIPYILTLFAYIGVHSSLDSSYLDLIRGKKEDLSLASTYAFREKRYWKFFLTGLCQSIFTFLWTLLLYIPGIIKTYSYFMTSYILKDDLDNGNSTTATSSITKSRALMDGHKWDFFVLNLSFLGWAFLATCTLGIGYFWLIPYIRATYAAFYNDLVKNATVETE